MDKGLLYCGYVPGTLLQGSFVVLGKKVPERKVEAKAGKLQQKMASAVSFH